VSRLVGYLPTYRLTDLPTVFSFFKRLWHGETEQVTTAAFIVAAASLISRIVGVLRDRILASTFGAGDVLDAYYAAFKIPDFLYNLVILGALSAAFIPVFTEYLEVKGKEEAWRLAEKILSLVGAVMIVASCALFFTLPSLMPLIAPGFAGEKLDLAIRLSRIMLISTTFLALSAVMGGILQSTRRFVAFSLAPVLYNLGIVAGAVFLVPWLGPVGLGWGVAMGAFLHFFAQSTVVISLGLKRLPRPSFDHEGVQRILRLMAPRTMGLAVSQVNLTVILAIASTLAVGSVAVLNLAMNLQAVPIGIFGISFAVAAFPALSRAVGAGQKQDFQEMIGSTTRKIVFFVLPASVALLILRAQIVRLLLGDGAFDWNDTIRTADTLGVFALSAVAQAVTPLLFRGFYALQDTRTALWISIVIEGTNIIAALLLMRVYGITGLAAAFTFSAWIGVGLLWWRLRARQGRLGTKKVWSSFWKILTASFVMAGAMIPVRNLIGTVYPLRTFFQVLLQAGAASVAGLIAFYIVCKLMRSPELEEFQNALIRHVWKRDRLMEGAEEAQGR
jgi:putative peptidoglycan lipid II flippase